jgi:hypothetical protein
LAAGIRQRFPRFFADFIVHGLALQPVSEAAELVGQDAGSLYALADIFEGFAIDKFI